MSRLVDTRIKVCRAEKKLTQAELADLVGVRRETILRLEQTKYVPNLVMAHDIAKVFGKSIEEVFIIEDDK